MKKYYLIILALLFSISVSFSQSSFYFTTDDINGEEIVMSTLLEKGPVMLAFWRTWCPSCKEEQRAMQILYEKYNPKGFQYIGINIDNQKSVSKVRPYVAAHNLTFPVIIDSDKKIFELCGGNEDMMPYSLVIDKTGSIIITHMGFKSGDESLFEEEIKNMLNIK